MHFFVSFIFLLFQTHSFARGLCHADFWQIEKELIGSWIIAWRYINESNVVQFRIVGQTLMIDDINSTYISLAWSKKASSVENADISMFFIGDQYLEDRYSRGHHIPAIDKEDQFCLIEAKHSEDEISFTFERSVNSNDVHDLSFETNLYLTFSMGLYNRSNDSTISIDPSGVLYHQSLNRPVRLIDCIQNRCPKKHCSNGTCSCLTKPNDDIDCFCFPSLRTCLSRTKLTKTSSPFVSALINGSCSTTDNPCSSHGICLNISSDQYLCQCRADYTGVFCQTPLFSLKFNDENNGCQCMNGGICLDDGNCSCSERFRGRFCQIENPCHNYCQNGGFCNSFCAEDSCEPPSCACLHGFAGPKCNHTDSCLSSPCRQGTCISSSNCFNNVCEFSCKCPNGTTGRFCDVLMNTCKPNPCLNNGHCVLNSDINPASYRCDCPIGFMGNHCEKIDRCVSSPCKNGGRCRLLLNNCSANTCPIECQCPSGTSGLYCDRIESACLTRPCYNGGTCQIDDRTGRPLCRCSVNSTGDRCETLLAFCSPTTCSNGGSCYLDSKSPNQVARCLCPEGFTDSFCQTKVKKIFQRCSQNPCGLNETCVQLSNSSYQCICRHGFVGSSCDETIGTSCSSSLCHHLSTCQDINTKANKSVSKCFCPPFLTGDRCQYANHCQNKPCLNGGTCLPLGPQSSFMCICPPGFDHYDCSIYVGTNCTANLCLNGGKCKQDHNHVRCQCKPGFEGPRCDWVSVCSPNTCDNGGTCRQMAPTMAECLCPTGFVGPTCRLRDSCTRFPCKNGGGCTTLLADTGTGWSAYRCVCPTGFYGQQCDTKTSSCATLSCPSYQVCSEQPTGPICGCPSNKVGTLCQYENPCYHGPECRNGGTCVPSNTDPPIRSCICPEGWIGPNCEHKKINDPCASNPCQTRGHCALSKSNRTYVCLCHDQFLGDQCERANPCASSPCLNQAICEPGWNREETWYTCHCAGTFTGERCETSLLNPCGGLCMNGSPCNNGVCVCPAKYTGTFCGFENPCYHPRCKNGGLCSVIYNTTSVSYTCTCPSSYTGIHCETSLTLPTNGSCSPACLNNGVCADGICSCPNEFIGSSCEHRNPCLDHNPCLNSGTCFGRYHLNGSVSTQCFCLQGYTGKFCEAILCSPSSCNGGVCTATQNNIVCSCSSGKFGDRCQFIDICAKKPCSTSERCEQIGNQYQCISCYDLSTYCSIYQLRNEYCDERYTILVDGNFLPVPQACRRSCGQCIPVQRLKDYSQTSSNSSSTKQKHTNPTVQSAEVERCVDRREDCAMQKAYGFCRILNEKYPDDCIKTCHPDCAHVSL